LDCTLRDGGYVNGWNFSMEFAKALYGAVSEAGVQYIEIGFINPDGKGNQPWINVTPETIRTLREHLPNGAKIALMIDFGKVPLDAVPPQEILGADLIRVATPKSSREEATAFSAKLAEKGYATTVNYMAITTYSADELFDLARIINDFRDRIGYFYIADSFGALLPRRIRDVLAILKLGGRDARLGFHPHNNIQLAFANSLEAIDAGVSILDGSVFGMGRGGGNLNLEAILAYLGKEGSGHFRLTPVLSFADVYMEQLKRSCSWGYSLPQLLSGTLGCHPNYPSRLLEQKSFTAEEIYELLTIMPDEYKGRFSHDRLLELTNTSQRAILQRIHKVLDVSVKELVERSQGKVLLLCGGPSVGIELARLQEYRQIEQSAIVSVHNPRSPVRPDALFFGNSRRLLEYRPELDDAVAIILGPSINTSIERNARLSRVTRVTLADLFVEGRSAFPSVMPSNSGVEAVLALVECGFSEILIAGMDGYPEEGPLYYYNEVDAVPSVETRRELNRVNQEELGIARTLLERRNASFRIVTKTSYADFFDPRL
jgi:4-hydroxy 2-oxovalerate aldolase